MTIGTSSLGMVRTRSVAASCGSSADWEARIPRMALMTSVTE
jgi:hypothetical protein